MLRMVRIAILHNFNSVACMLTPAFRGKKYAITFCGVCVGGMLFRNVDVNLKN